MSTNDITTAAALIRLEAAVAATYAAFRTVGLGPDPVRDAILGHVADTIAIAACECDGVPLPVTDIDDDGGGGVRTR